MTERETITLYKKVGRRYVPEYSALDAGLSRVSMRLRECT